MTPEKINQILEIPAEDASSPVKSEEAAFIYNFIKEHSITRTLETGFAYAKSASHIMAATQSKHIACDPFQDKYQDLGLKNVRKLNQTDLLEFHNDYSHNVLPRLLREKKKFEFIFIDGDHKFDGELIDFYYADLLIANKGFILLHDTWMRSTRLLMTFIRSNRKDYKAIATGLRNLALYQKIDIDKRNGMHFREFYTIRSVLSHYGILYLTTGKKNVLKNILFKIKEFVK